MSDAKFRWFDAMNHDAKLRLGDRAVLGYCGIRYAMEEEGFEIKVRQETIAKNLGVHLNTVKAAFAAGRERGWINKTGDRQRGRGNHEPDTHTLARPIESEPTNRYSGVSEWVQQDVPISRKKVQRAGEIGTTDNAPTSENDVPQGLPSGITNYNRVLGTGIAQSQAPAPISNPQPGSRIPVEPDKVPLHLSVLRNHFTGSPLTLRELGRFHFGVEPTKPQMESIRQAMVRAVKSGLVAVEYSGRITAYRPLLTSNWPDAISSDMAASRTPSRIGPER